MISWEGILGETSETKFIITWNITEKPLWAKTCSSGLSCGNRRSSILIPPVAQSNTIWNMFRPIYVLQIIYHYHKRIWQINLNYSIGLPAPLLYYSQYLTTESKGMWTRHHRLKRQKHNFCFSTAKMKCFYSYINTLRWIIHIMSC